MRSHLDHTHLLYDATEPVASRMDTTCSETVQLKLRCLLQREQNEAEIWIAIQGVGAAEQQIAVDHIPGYHRRGCGVVPDIPEQNIPIDLIAGIAVGRDLLGYNRQGLHRTAGNALGDVVGLAGIRSRISLERVQAEKLSLGHIIRRLALRTEGCLVQPQSSSAVRIFMFRSALIVPPATGVLPRAPD